MSTILCLRRGGGRSQTDPRLLWYVTGFAVERDGVRVATVEEAVPRLDGDVPAALALRTAGGPALLPADAVAAVDFRERLLVAAADPA